jgi:hypothetical protein
MSGIPYFYLMQKNRIQGKGENNKKKRDFFLLGGIAGLFNQSSIRHKKKAKKPFYCANSS